MENSVMLNAVCNEPVSLKVLEEPFYRKGFSPFVNKETGTWWEYDDDKKGFFDTGIIAQGRDGNDYVITEQDYNTIVERTLSNVNPTLDEKLSSKLPKSPTDWEPWTAEEQASARERMGIDKFEEIVIITLAEDSTPVIDLGAEYGKLFIMFEIPAGDTCIGNRYIKNQNNHNIGFFPSGSVFQSSARFATSIISRYGDYWTCDTNYGSNNNASHLGSNRSAHKLNDAIITQLTFSDSIRLGSKISIYGVRV